jgi:hypothetical protein
MRAWDGFAPSVSSRLRATPSIGEICSHPIIGGSVPFTIRRLRPRFVQV